MLKTFKLSNGIQVATYNLPNLRSVHLRLSAKGGSIVENKKNNGIAHFMEHILVQGIPSLPNVEEFSSYIESLAGTYSAFTESLLIGFNITVPFTHINDALRISSEVFFEPLFTDEAINRERGVVIDEIKQKMDSHWYKISEFFHESAFKSTSPLQIYNGGVVKNIEKTSRQEIVNFWQNFFVPKNIYLLVTGNFPNDKIVEYLENYFGKYPNQHNFPGFPPMDNNDFTPRGVKVRFDKKLKTNYLDLVFPSISLTDPLDLRVKQNLALVILGQLRNSRLFKLLRYQKGLVYNVRAGSGKYPGLGYVYISSETPPLNLEEVVTLITKELKNFLSLGPTKEELEFAKNYLTNQWLMTFDQPSSIANWVEGDLLWEDSVMLPEEAAGMIKSVDTKDILELMQKHWDFSKLNLVVQGPIKKTPETIKKFEKIISDLK